MSNESMRRDAWKIIRKTLKEAMPDQAVEKALRARSFTKPVTLFSIGKAAWQMASAAERSLGNQIKQGSVLTKYGHSKGEIPRCEILEAGHPVPDANSVFGAQKMAGLARSLTQNDQVLFLISGGGSGPPPGWSPFRLRPALSYTLPRIPLARDIGEYEELRPY